MPLRAQALKLVLLCLLLSEALVLPLVKEGPAHLLPAALNLIHQVHLAQLLRDFLVLPFLLCNLLLLELLGPLGLPELPLAPALLLHLLDEEPALSAAASASLARPVLKKEPSKHKILLLSRLRRMSFAFKAYHMESCMAGEVQGVDVGVAVQQNFRAI